MAQVPRHHGVLQWSQDTLQEPSQFLFQLYDAIRERLDYQLEWENTS